MNTEEQHRRGMDEEMFRALHDELLTQIRERGILGAWVDFRSGMEVVDTFQPPTMGMGFATIRLDLVREQPYAEVSDYPDNFGRYREIRYDLSPEFFHEVAVNLNLDPKWQQFRTQEDWDRLFDDELREAVASAFLAHEKEKEAKLAQERAKYGVTIPIAFRLAQPAMNLTLVHISLYQLASSHVIKVTQEDGTYQVEYMHLASMSSRHEFYKHTLSKGGCVYVETLIENIIMSQDDSTWESAVGGDSMQVEIKRTNAEDITLDPKKPLAKYRDALHILERLAKYGD